MFSGEIWRVCATLAFILLQPVFPPATAQNATNKDLTCGLGRSFGLDFCYDQAILGPGLPMGAFAYVLTTPNRGHFITVSMSAADGKPTLDLEALVSHLSSRADLPLGKNYQFTTTLEFIEGDAQAYNAALSGPKGFGFFVRAIRLGRVPGGLVQVSLIDTTAQTDEANKAALDAFAEVISTFRLL